MKRWVVLLALCLLGSSAQARTMTATWGYDAPPSDLSGFTIYMEGEPVADIKDPAARTYTGEIPERDGKTCYTIDAYDAAGGRSPQSPCYYLDPVPGSPGNFRIEMIVDVTVAPPK